MEAVWVFLVENKEWLFSGLGVCLLVGLFQMLRGRHDSSKQVIRSGHNSINVQAGQDITIGNNKKSDAEQ